jgi:hypothetical protein
MESVPVSRRRLAVFLNFAFVVGVLGSGFRIDWKSDGLEAHPTKEDAGDSVTKTGRNLVKTRLRPVGDSATSLTESTRLGQRRSSEDLTRFLCVEEDPISTIWNGIHEILVGKGGCLSSIHELLPLVLHDLL